jgi:hypothetical protein
MIEDFDAQDGNIDIDNLNNQPTQPDPILNDLLSEDGPANEINKTGAIEPGAINILPSEHAQLGEAVQTDSIQRDLINTVPFEHGQPGEIIQRHKRCRITVPDIIGKSCPFTCYIGPQTAVFDEVTVKIRVAVSVDLSYQLHLMLNHLVMKINILIFFFNKKKTYYYFF